MSVTARIIWAEIETLDIVLELAKRNCLSDAGFQAELFMQDLSKYKARIERDLIEATSE